MSRTGLFVLVLLASVSGGVRAAPGVAARSPDERVRIEVSLRKVGEMDAVPHYWVTFDGKEFVGHSRLGVESEGDTALGGPCEVLFVDERSTRDEFTQVTGKRRAILAVQQERTEFRVPADARAFALPLNGFTTSHEKRYQPKPAKELPKDWLLGLPPLLECPAVRHPLPHRTPWRVVMLGDRVGRLVESDLVLALSEPCAD